MLQMFVKDQNHRISEEQLLSAIRDNNDFLKKAQTGEKEFSDSLGWLEIDKWAGEDTLRRIEEIASRIRKSCDAFVLIGVGGSNNAARSVIKALASDSPVEIIYAGNSLSPYALNQVLHRLEGKDYAIDCIAKNFETLEPGSAFRILREAMEKNTVLKRRQNERFVRARMVLPWKNYARRKDIRLSHSLRI